MHSRKGLHTRWREGTLLTDPPWPETEPSGEVSHSSQCRGKAPPVNPFIGESPEVRYENWLPSLKQAAEWNGWKPSEMLIQLAGHLCGCTLREWNLLAPNECSTFIAAVEAHQQRLDLGSRTQATQDFHHALRV